MKQSGKRKIGLLITEGRGKIIGRWWHDSYQTIPYEVTLPQGYEKGLRWRMDSTNS